MPSLPPLPHSLLDRAAAQDARARRAAPRGPWHGAGSERLLCAACDAPISAQTWALTVEGAHEHRFVNPHGYLFHVGCFRHAPGCRPQGDEHAEYSWFPGRRWQLAGCATCSVHLGWGFLGREPTFFGLILDRLRTGEEPEA